jgi:hypothetical protein
MNTNHRVIHAYHERLAAAVSRSPLLKAITSKNTRLLDCSRLRAVSENLPQELLDAVVQTGKQVSIDLRPRAPRPSSVLVTSELNKVSNGSEDDAFKDDTRNKELEGLYHLLDHRIRRHGEQAKRQTGVHTVWLGYPLLYMSVGDGANRDWLLSPVFLWPVSLILDVRHPGNMLILRDEVAGPPQFNGVMASRISRWTGCSVPVALPSDDGPNAMGWNHIKRHLSKISDWLDLGPEINCSGPLEAVPSANSFTDRGDRRLYHSAVLGSFQTKDGAILKDLDELKDRDLDESVAAAFAEGTLLPTAILQSSPPEEESPHEEDRYLVSKADFSQEQVVWKARREPGLIVHGPPGTGKSQTIVNIIADALAHGRTVLMVCQKQAATRVVLERLRAAGLADLCAEVHQPEADRQAVFGQIRTQAGTSAQVSPPQPTNSPGRDQLAREITRLESELDRYARTLHERHPRIGLSYRRMKAIEGTAEVRFPTVQELPSLRQTIAECSFQKLEELCREVHKIGCLFRKVDALNNPWRHRQPGVRMSAIFRAKVEAILERLKERDSQYNEHIHRFGSGIELLSDPLNFLNDATEVVRRLQPLAEVHASAEAQVTRRWLRSILGSGDDELQRLAALCREAVTLAKRVKATSLDPAWAERCEGLTKSQLENLADAARDVLGSRGRWWRFFSSTYRRDKAVIRRLRPGAVGATYWSSAELLLAHLEARQLRDQLACLNQSLIPQAPFRQFDEQSQVQFPRLAAKTMEDAAWLSVAARSRPWIAELLAAASLASADRACLADLLARARVSIERASILVEMRKILDELGQFFLPEGLEEPRRAIERGRSPIEWIENVAKGLDVLSDLMALELDRHGRDGLVRDVLGALEDYEQGLRGQACKGLPEPPADLREAEYGEWWVALVRYAASRIWQDACESEHRELICITPEDHAEKVRQLRNLLSQKQAMEAEAIRAHWATRQAAHRGARWAQMFPSRAGNGNSGSKTLRQAIELSLPEGLLAMRPCWLANPASVCDIFPLQPGLFDLVIFDEASQCPIEQALPAIYRGKVLIVSGDEKQLPPTDFFLTKLPDGDGDGNDGDDPDGEATDSPVDASARQFQQLGQQFMLEVEDLLQAAVGLFRHEAQAKLLVHYRSRHPALIEFSNQAFYDGRLEAPPSVHHSSCGMPPIQYLRVDGTYSDRKNHDEALKVISVLRRFWLADGACPTIGVVTFNKPQQELIEDLIEEECERDEAFAARFKQELSRQDDNQDVGFFVRNLENVQGDERDVMIFSTTFGRNPEGKFLRNFGPVGHVGGERRLNVAVTRAKDQIIIVGSMPIDEIATALGTDLGPGAQLTPASYLQLYLAYAQAVSDRDRARAESIMRKLRRQPKQPQTDGPESPFEAQVLDVLKGWGLEVDCQVGDSGFRIDLGVRHHDPTLGYALGIECDGATYHASRSARARDVWREDILRSQGWVIHRIWSTRWWSYREREIERLRVEVQQALNRSHAQEPPADNCLSPTEPGIRPVDEPKEAASLEAAPEMSTEFLGPGEIASLDSDRDRCPYCGRLPLGQTEWARKPTEPPPPASIDTAAPPALAQLPDMKLADQPTRKGWYERMTVGDPPNLDQHEVEDEDPDQLWDDDETTLEAEEDPVDQDA